MLGLSARSLLQNGPQGLLVSNSGYGQPQTRGRWGASLRLHLLGLWHRGSNTVGLGFASVPQFPLLEHERNCCAGSML